MNRLEQIYNQLKTFLLPQKPELEQVGARALLLSVTMLEIVNLLFSLFISFEPDRIIHFSLLVIYIGLLIYGARLNSLLLPVVFICTSMGLTAAWFTNYGSSSGIKYMFLLLLVVINFISDRKLLGFYLVFTFINVFTLYGVEAFWPDLINAYGIDKQYLFRYRLLNFAFISAVVIAMVLYIKYHFDKVQENYQSKTRALNEQSILKTDVFVKIAHETKTPLTLISNYLDKYIAKGNTDCELLVVQDNFNRLKENMINFLDTEKIHQGKLLYNHSNTVHLSALLDNLFQLFLQVAAAKQIDLTKFIEKNLYIKADSQAIERIINNLLDNAVKFTPDNGKIHMYLIQSGGNIVISIKDSGVGIEKEDKHKIFKPYYQADPKGRHYRGSGMGLAVVKGIVEELNGSISVHSEYGHGSEFIIELPMANQHIDSEAKHFVNSEIKNIYRNKAIKPTQIAENKATVLIVEDNTDLLNYLIDELNGFLNVLPAINGVQALQIIRNQVVPDVIVSDVMMDEMDGYGLFEQIRNDEKFAHIPFIFLSARTKEEEKLNSLQDGAFDFIAKPFNIKELRLKILNLIKSRNNDKKRIIHKALQMLEKEVEKETGQRSNASFDSLCEYYLLTKREKELLKHVIEGRKYNEISEKLYISPRTVSRHVQNIFDKTGVNDKARLINLFK